jgi:predicted metal-dependent peptidase
MASAKKQKLPVLDSVREKALEKAWKEAATLVIYKDPLYVKYVLNTRMSISYDIKAIAGIRPTSRFLEILWNPAMVEQAKLTLSDMVQILKHEYGHILLHHCWCRLPNPKKDNVAADIEINQHPWIEVDKSPYIQKNCWTYQKEKQPERKSREFYYGKLKDEEDGDGRGDGDGGGNLDDHEIWGQPDPAVEEAWKRLTQEILENARSRGLIPGGYIEEIEARWKKVRSIQQYLKRICQRYISLSLKESSTRTRPSRRFPLLPGVKYSYGPKVVWAIDTSGSMSSKNLKDITSVIRWMQKQVPVGVLQCDADVTEAKWNCKITGKVKMKGRGGTSFQPVFKYISEHWEDKIDLLIYATDMYGDWPKKHPPYPVIWLNVSDWKGDVPFGRVIQMEGDK